MAVEDIILARRSLIRGVVSRCEEIAERFTETNEEALNHSQKSTSRSFGRHSLAIVKHEMSGITVGFAIKNREKGNSSSIRVFFNGMEIILFFVEESLGAEGTRIWGTNVLQAENTDLGINGMSETPFWENEFEQALKDHMPLITDYIVRNGRMCKDSTSTTNHKRMVDMIDKAVSVAGDEADMSFDANSFSSVGKVKSLGFTSLSDGFGQYYGVSLGKSVNDIAKRFREKARIVPDPNNRLQGLIASIIADSEDERYRTYCDEDGNTIIDLYSGDRVHTGEKYDYSDLLEAIHDSGKGSTTMTSSEIIELAKKKHYENRDLYKEAQQDKESQENIENEKARRNEIARNKLDELIAKQKNPERN